MERVPVAVPPVVLGATSTAPPPALPSRRDASWRRWLWRSSILRHVCVVP
jgi:hypothetical protein